MKINSILSHDVLFPWHIDMLRCYADYDRMMHTHIKAF